MTKLDEIREKLWWEGEHGSDVIDWDAFPLQRKELEKIAEAIYQDGFDVSDFCVSFVDAPFTVHFWSRTDEEKCFDLVKEKEEENSQWLISYTVRGDKCFVEKIADSIAEAIEKYELYFPLDDDSGTDENYYTEE